MARIYVNLTEDHLKLIRNLNVQALTDETVGIAKDNLLQIWTDGTYFGIDRQGSSRNRRRYGEWYSIPKRGTALYGGVG